MNIHGTLVTFLIVVGVVAVFAGAMYGCQNSSEQYYRAQKSCVDNKGSWVPTGGSYRAMCIYGQAVRQ